MNDDHKTVTIPSTPATQPAPRKGRGRNLTFEDRQRGGKRAAAKATRAADGTFARRDQKPNA